MKGYHFFHVGLGVLLLALLVAWGQVPIAEPEPGQPAPAEVVAAQTEATTGSIEALPNIDPADRKFLMPHLSPRQRPRLKEKPVIPPNLAIIHCLRG
ncbi:MAG: hypothetical protein HYR94_29675 [Chloroflexi bacterium]|nr:hypothetical protein [Chloroflexota bacterium]